MAVVGPHGMPDDVRAVADVTLATPFEAARLLAFLARVFGRELGPSASPGPPRSSRSGAGRRRPSGRARS
jgi:hypothetical protein